MIILSLLWICTHDKAFHKRESNALCGLGQGASCWQVEWFLPNEIKLTLTVGKTQYVLILDFKTFFNDIQYISLIELCLMVLVDF